MYISFVWILPCPEYLGTVVQMNLDEILLFVCLFVHLVFFFFHIGSHSVVQAVAKLSMELKPTLNSQHSFCLRVLIVGITHV